MSPKKKLSILSLIILVDTAPEAIRYDRAWEERNVFFEHTCFHDYFERGERPADFFSRYSPQKIILSWHPANIQSSEIVWPLDNHTFHYHYIEI